MVKKRIRTSIIKTTKIIVLISGLVFLVFILLAFTSLPYWSIHWLGTSKSNLEWEPRYIIMLGGGGMPSESNLMRCWYTSRAAENFKDAKVVIADPGAMDDSLSTPRKIEKELLLRGVDTARIIYENKGTNTRAQALNCLKLINFNDAVLLVSSPEHIRRAVLCFRKAGFKKVSALPAFENASEADLFFSDDELGGNKLLIPDVGNNISIRYQLWNHLKYEIIFIREIVAICYYKAKGWI